MIIDQLAGKTYAQVLRLAEQAALTVDPALAERRREHAQQERPASAFFREQAGTAALSGRDLPPDEALAAMAAVNARAEEYKESGAFGDTPMDALRACAYLDLINGLPGRGADRGRRNARRRRRRRRVAGPGPGARGRQNRGRGQSRRRGEGREPSTARPRQRRRRAGSGQPGPRHGRTPALGRPDTVPPDRPDPREAAGGFQADPDACSCTDCDGSCLAGDYDLDLDGRR